MTPRRLSAGIAAAALAAVALTACSSSSTPEPAPTTPSVIGGDVLPPTIVEPGQNAVTVTVGTTVTFNVADPGDWTINTGDSAIMSVTPGGTVDGVTSIPGGTALAAGMTDITLENAKGKEAWVVTVTVTDGTEEPMASMTPPIIVEPGQTTATATVGKMITFNVTDPNLWTITTSDDAIASAIPGGTFDGVTSNPGSMALKAGTATITLENTIGKEAWVVTVTVTE